MSPADRKFWDVEAQTMPVDQLRALQDERLRAAVAHAYEGSGFFRRRLEAAGVRPDDVKTVDDITALPPFAKADLRQNEAEFPPVGDYRVSGLSGAIRLATSTGTTGKPTFTLWTAHDLTLDYELAARRHWRNGVRPGHVVANAHPGYLNGGQAIIAGAIEYMGCLSVSIGPPVTDDELERSLRNIESIPIDHWTLLPAAALRIREVAAKIGWSGRLPDVETMTPARQLGTISAGQECIGTLGSTCDAANFRGAHIAEDYAVVEVVDPVTMEAVAEGQRGYFLCTSLGRDNPMLRYNLEDVIRVDSRPCGCGETHRRAFWDGRGKDIVTIQDKWILPIDVWMELPLAMEFVLVRQAPNSDRLRVRVEGTPESDLVDRLENRLGVPVDVEAVDVGTFARASYKAERVIDEPRS